jgi:hypothetical protein
MNWQTKLTSEILIISLIALISTVSYNSCSQSDIIYPEEIKSEMLSLMNSYADAINEVNYEKTISHYQNSPEFFFYSDGAYYNYDALSSHFKTSFINFKSVKMELDTIVVRVLSSDLAAIFTSFHTTFIDKSSLATRIIGEATWIAKRKSDKWKFVFVHGHSRLDTTQ